MGNVTRLIMAMLALALVILMAGAYAGEIG
jgi:hypothetical protein